MKKVRVYFLLLPHIHILDVAGADHVFYEAKQQGADIEVHYCSVNGKVVSTSGLALGLFEHCNSVQVEKNDIVVIPGSESSYLLSGELADAADVLEWLRTAYNNGATICSVCTGAFLLARAGLLDGKQCTTHWTCTQKLQELFPSARVQENVLFTQDGTVYTSAGVSSGIDLALHIVSELFGEALAFTVARMLVLYIRRTGHEAQHSLYMVYRNHINSGIHAVQDWIIDNLSKNFTLDDLARVAFMSTRTLTRQFKNATGVSVGEYIRLLRKETALKLIENTTHTRVEIAQMCGLQSVRQLQRIIHS
ncbi:MAG: DJ-1/PfpI family protein [Candidatus Kapabacteria bacterium]|nr:DJ-1/PfpI family protein [Candidatus Kapabacteria bacterium]MBX7153420.1 DJ-1/PfpI family protein [Bacteroidota bacterium]